jgi:site-specific recombinase XerD
VLPARARAGVSNTQHTHARTLRAFLNFCKREGLIAESPFAKVKMPKAAKVDKPALSPADVRRAGARLRQSP